MALPLLFLSLGAPILILGGATGGGGGDENLSKCSWDGQGHLARKLLVQKSHVLFSPNESTRAFALGKKHATPEQFKEEGKLYYSGLASDLRGRLRWHLRDRHANRWDTFSVYLTIGDQHLRELESLILRVAQPPGNRQLGKFSGAQNLNRIFGRAIAKKQRIERNRILGRESIKEEVKQGARQGRRIRGKYKDNYITAKLRPDNRVRMKGKLYTSPSAAASAIRKGPTNGWSFWHYERGPGDWVPIDQLRNS